MSIRKPVYPFATNKNDPFASNLVCQITARDGVGTQLMDGINSNLVMPFTTGFTGLEDTVYGKVFTPGSGPAQITTPDYLKGISTVTLEYIGVRTDSAAIGAFNDLINITYSTPGVSPFITYGIGFNGTPVLVGSFTNGSGGLSSTVSSVLPAFGELFHVVFSCANGAQALYMNGLQLATGNISFSGGIATSLSQFYTGAAASRCSMMMFSLYNVAVGSLGALELYRNRRLFHMLKAPTTMLQRGRFNFVTSAGVDEQAAASAAFVNSRAFVM